MKVKIDKQVDALYITFNDNKIIDTISIEEEINVDVDINNKVVGLEVLHYSILRQGGNELLQEDNLDGLLEDDVLFFMHHGYNIAWFSMKDIAEGYTVCKSYIEGGNIEYGSVSNFIQDGIDFIIRHTVNEN